MQGLIQDDTVKLELVDIFKRKVEELKLLQKDLSHLYSKLIPGDTQELLDKIANIKPIGEPISLAMDEPRMHTNILGDVLKLAFFKTVENISIPCYVPEKYSKIFNNEYLVIYPQL